MSKKLMFVVLIISNLVVLYTTSNNLMLPKGIKALLLLIILTISLVIYLHNLVLQRKYKIYKKKSQRMYQRSICDGMTGLYNHTYIINRLRNLDADYSLMMLDIDNFKEINDTYGHHIGDEIIKFVADQIEANTRKTDLVGRYGGDEFLIALMNCKQREEIEMIVSKIKEKIAAIDEQFAKKDLQVTVSAGIYTSSHSDFDNILTKTDKLLYQAKEQGKNNIVINTD